MSNDNNSNNKNSVQVFVRIRPLTSHEVNEKHESLGYKIVDSTKIVLPSTKKVFGPFTQIFQDNHNNQYVFQETIEHSVSNILTGETICCFCHGHTGSGKTHTILGYGSEYGLYDLSSINLWKLIDSYNSSETNERKKLKLQIRFAEQYTDKVYDLLNNREECFVREDSNGTVHIRSATLIDEKGRVKVGGLKPEFALNHEDVIKIVNKGIDNRTTGSSSIHDQSSRSHSILEFQIVNQIVQETTSSLMEAEATLVPIGKKKDDTAILIQMKSYQKDEHGKWVEIPDAVSLEEKKLLKDLEDQVLEAERVIASLKLKLQDEMKSYSNISLGGMFVFIDLAGAEYVTDPSMVAPKTRTAKELKEGQYINGSLLALKECIRSIHNKKQHVPFRNSKLTQILRDYLLAKNAQTLMIGTISSSNLHEAHAKNTLHYAELAAKVNYC